MILATLRMTFSPKKVAEALRILRSITGQSRVQPGCLSCRIYRNGQQDNVIMFEQYWGNEADLENYLRSDEYRQVLMVLEMAIKQPEIRFGTISSSTGIETIGKAREESTRGKADELPVLP